MVHSGRCVYRVCLNLKGQRLAFRAAAPIGAPGVGLEHQRRNTTEVLPAPRRVDAVPSGPDQGPNFSLIFVDRQQVLDQAGALDRGGLERSKIVTVPARQPLTGESATFPVRTYSTLAHEVPGPYGTSTAAGISRDARVSGEPAGAGLASESWCVATRDGRSLELTVAGRIGMPGRVSAQAALRSPTQPAFMRVYRIEQAVDQWRSALPGSSDRVTTLQLRSDIAELMPLLGNQPQVLSVAHVPWYQRQMFIS